MSITPTFSPDYSATHASTFLHSETMLQSNWNQSFHSSNVNPRSNNFSENHPLLLLATAAIVPLLVRLLLHAVNVIWPNFIFLCITRSFFQRESIIVEEPIHSSSRCSFDKRKGNTIWSSGTLIDAIMLYAAHCLENRKLKEESASGNRSNSAERDDEPKEKKRVEYSHFGGWLYSSVSTVFHLFSPSPPQEMLCYGQFLYAPVDSSDSSAFSPTNGRSVNKRKDLKRVLKDEYYLSVVPPEDRSVEVEPGLWLRFEGCDAISRQSKEYYSGRYHKGNTAGGHSPRHKRKRRHRRGFGGAEGEEEGLASYWMSDFIRADEERATKCGAKGTGSSFMDTNGAKGIGAPMRKKGTGVLPFPFLDALKRPFPLKHRFSSRKKGDANAPPKWWRRGGALHPLGRGGGGGGRDRSRRQQEEEDDTGTRSSRSTGSNASSNSSEREESSENTDDENAASPEIFIPSRRVWLYCCDLPRGRVASAENDASFLQWAAEERDEYDVRRRWWKEKVVQEEKEERRSDGIHRVAEESQLYRRTKRKKGVVETAILEEEALAATLPKPSFSSSTQDKKGVKDVTHTTHEKATSKQENDENRAWQTNGWGLIATVARIRNLFRFRSFPSSASSHSKAATVSRLDHFIRRAYLWYHYHQLLQEESKGRGRETGGGGTGDGVGVPPHSTRGRSPTDTSWRHFGMETGPCPPLSSAARGGLPFPTAMPLERKRYVMFPSKPEYQERIDAALKWNEKGREGKGGEANGSSVSEDDYGSDYGSSTVVEDGVLWSVKRYEILNPSPPDGHWGWERGHPHRASPPRIPREAPNAPVDDAQAEHNGIPMPSEMYGNVSEEGREERGEGRLQEEEASTKTISTRPARPTTLFQHPCDGEATEMFLSDASVSSPDGRPHEQEQTRNERRGKMATEDGAKATVVDDDDDDEKLFENLFIPQREALRKRLRDFKKRKGPYAKPGYPSRLYILLSPGREGSGDEVRPPSLPPSEGIAHPACCTDAQDSEAAGHDPHGAWERAHSISEEEEGAMEMEAVTMNIVKEAARYLQRSIVILSLKTVLTNQYVNSWLSGCQLRCDGEEECVASDDYTDSSSYLDTSTSGKFVPKKTRLRPSNVVYWIQDIEEAENVVDEDEELSRQVEMISEWEKKEEVAVKRDESESRNIKMTSGSEEKAEGEDDEEEENEEGEEDEEGENEEGEEDEEGENEESESGDDGENEEGEEKVGENEEEEEGESADHEETPNNSSAITFRKALTQALSRAACAVAEEKDRLSLDGLIRALVPHVAGVSGRVVIMSSHKRIGEESNALTPRWIRTPLLINLHLSISCSIQAPEVLQMLHFYHLHPTLMEEEVIRQIFPFSSRMNREKRNQLGIEKVEKEDHRKTLRVSHSFLQDCCFRYQSVEEVLHAACTAKWEEVF